MLPKKSEFAIKSLICSTFKAIPPIQTFDFVINRHHSLGTTLSHSFLNCPYDPTGSFYRTVAHFTVDQKLPHKDKLLKLGQQTNFSLLSKKLRITSCRPHLAEAKISSFSIA